jgi:hypothetical protein
VNYRLEVQQDKNILRKREENLTLYESIENRSEGGNYLF